MSPSFADFRKLLSHLHAATGFSRGDSQPFPAQQHNGLTVQCQTTWPANTGAWQALCDHSPTSTLFQTPAWQIAAWSVGQTKGRMRLLTVHQRDRLLAVLPLALTDAGALHTPTVPLSDYLDPLVDADHKTACWEAIVSYIASLWDHRTVEFTLYNLRENTRLRTILAQVAASLQFQFEEAITDHAPMIDLPATWAAFLESLAPHERKEVRRKLGKAESTGEARLVKCGESEFPAMLDRALSMMESRPDEKGQAITRYVRPLLQAVGLALFQQRRLELFTLLIQNEPACCLLQSPTPRGPMLYNLGYDPASKEWSPGVVAIAMSIRNAIADGHGTFDLLRGREPYKHKLGATDRPLHRITLKRTV